MTAPYTTRAESEAPPAQLLEIMCAAAYEATRTHSFPKWPEVGPAYRSDMHKAQTAAIRAAEAAGYSFERKSGHD